MVAIDGVPCIRNVRLGDAGGVNAIWCSSSLYADGEVLGDVEAVPLVIDHEDLARKGVALLVAIPAEQVAVESPFEIHWVLGEDEVFVIVTEGCPLAVDEDFGARDIEDDAVIVALLQSDGFIGFDAVRQSQRHKVFLEEASRIHQDEWL